MEAEYSISNSIQKLSKNISKQNTIEQIKQVFNNGEYLDNLN